MITKGLTIFLTLKTATFLVTGLVLLHVSGCSAQRINMIEQGDVSTQIIETHPITVKRVSIYRDPKGITLSGDVIRRNRSLSPLSGHVDVELIGSDGEVLYEDTLRLRMRRVTVTRRVIKGEFTTHWNFDLPVGSIVRLSHHEGKHPNG